MFRAIVLTISFLSLLFINRGVGALNLPQKYCVYSCPKVDGNNLPLDNADKNVEGGPACEYYDAPSGLRNMCDYTTSVRYIPLSRNRS